MLGGSTICVTFCVARYYRVHVAQPGTTKTFLLDINLPDAYWNIKECIALLPCMYHPMQLPPTNTSVTSHAPFQQSNLVPRPFLWNKTTMHLPFTYICHAHLKWQHLNARPLIFHIGTMMLQSCK